MESIPIFITLVLMLLLSVGIVFPFLLSLTFSLVGVYLLIRRSRKLEEESSNKKHLPIFMIVSGLFMFIVLGYTIFDFIRTVFY